MNLILSVQKLQFYYINIEFNHIISFKYLRCCAFIIQSVEEINIRLTDYELPKERRKFIRTTKQITSKKDKKLKQLITDLKDTAGIKLLTDLLKYLLANRYDSDIDILQSMLNE